MPVILHTSPKAVADLAEADVLARLCDAAGAPTLEGRVLEAFLEGINFDELLNDPDLSEFVEAVEKTKAKKKDDAEDAKDGADDEDTEDMEEGTKYTVQTMLGEDAAEFVDADDLVGMFEWFVGQMPATTVEEKVLKAAGLRLLGEETEEVVTEAKEGDEGAIKLDEAKGRFKKGDFVKLHAGKKVAGTSKTGPELVKRMLVAMMQKGAIKRAGAGSGYTPRGTGTPGKGYSGGDYKKDSGYGEGTPAGQARVAKYKAGGKGKASAAKAVKKVKGAAAAEMKAKAKEAAAKSKAKANRLEKKKPGVVGAKKKSLLAHDTDTRDDRMDEGLSLAAGIVKAQVKRPING